MTGKIFKNNKKNRITFSNAHYNQFAYESDISIANDPYLNMVWIEKKKSYIHKVLPLFLENRIILRLVLCKEYLNIMKYFQKRK